MRNKTPYPAPQVSGSPSKWRLTLSHALCQFIARYPFPGVERLNNTLSRILAPCPLGLVEVRTAYGFSLLLDPAEGEGLEKALYYKGYYELGTINFMNRFLRQGDIFVDVGSNIGLMALAAAQVVGDGRVLAFEPVPETFSMLTKNLQLNGVANVETFNCCLGSECGRREIYERMHLNRGGASLVRSDDTTGSHLVEIFTLDAVLASKGMEKVSLVKIDVEGWEHEVLKGGRELLASKEAPALILECSEENPGGEGQGSALFDFVTTINAYRVFRLRKGKEKYSSLVPVKTVCGLPHHDNIFCLLPPHIERLSGFLET